MDDGNNPTFENLQDNVPLDMLDINGLFWEVADNACRYLLCEDMGADVPNHNYILFIGVNPSIANARQPDDTYDVLRQNVQQLNFMERDLDTL